MYSGKLIAFLKSLLPGEKPQGLRSMVVVHESWCPLLRLKGMCTCDAKTYELSKEEFDRLVFEKKQLDEEVDEELRQLDLLLRGTL